MKKTFPYLLFLYLIGCASDPSNSSDDKLKIIQKPENQKELKRVLDSLDANVKPHDTAGVKIMTEDGSVITIKKADTGYYKEVKEPHPTRK